MDSWAGLAQINTAAVVSTGPALPICFLVIRCLHSNKLQALAIDPFVEEQLSNTI
jgi:hypothetical protein